LTLEYGTDRISRKVGNKYPLFYAVENPEEYRSQLHCARNLKSREEEVFSFKTTLGDFVLS
jgi:hypothetical protein